VPGTTGTYKNDLGVREQVSRRGRSLEIDISAERLHDAIVFTHAPVNSVTGEAFRVEVVLLPPKINEEESKWATIGPTWKQEHDAAIQCVVM
jgi:hypothetical protein